MMTISKDTFEIKGLSELDEAVGYMLTHYNDQCESGLKTLGNRFKKSVIAKTPTGTTNKVPSKKLNKSYTVTNVQGDFSNKWVDIRSKSPHFHLVERGHEIYDRNGEPSGRRIEPVYMMKRTYEEYKEKYPQEMKEIIVKLGEKAKKKSKSKKGDNIC